MRDATPGAGRIDPATWRRIGMLTRGAFGAVRDAYTRIALGALAGAALGTVVAFLTAPSPQGLVAALVVAVFRCSSGPRHWSTATGDTRSS